MRRGKGLRIMRITAMLLSALALLGLGGCERVIEPEPVCGGVTDKTDAKAPKTIKSREISDFYAKFCLMGEWASGHETDFFTFSVKPDESGALTAREELTGAAAPADRALLDALQGVIDKWKLSEQNGEYRTTAGLPSEFRPCTLTVRYASGETLTFTHDNDPEAAWAKDMYLTLADWFAFQGVDALLPPQTVTGTVENVSLTYHDPESDTFYDYGAWSDPDEQGRRVIFRFRGEEQTELALDDAEAFFAGVERIMKSCDLRRYDHRSALYGYEQTKEDQENPFSNAFELTFWFEDGDQLFIHTSAPDEIDKLMPLAAELAAYFDARLDAE